MLASILSTVKEIPVRILLLRNFQYDFLDLRRDILRHLEGSHLEELDVSQNGLIIFNPGFTEFVPSLKRLICQDNHLSEGREYRGCSILDIMLHPELEVLELGYDAFSGKRNRSKRAATEPVFSPRVAHTDWFHQKCGKFTNISCDNVELPPKDRSCPGGDVVPLKKLKVLVYSHTPRTTLYENPLLALRKNEILCFDPTNQLEYLDASYNYYGDTFNFGFGIFKGVHQLWYMNLQYNELLFTNFAPFSILDD